MASRCVLWEWDGSAMCEIGQDNAGWPDNSGLEVSHH